jgi:SNF2 family DNA or RNA helicase
MFTGELLPYQHDAVNMMVDRGKCLVAYDLGLGKTIITIAACERLRAHIDAPVLVVCLSSLKYQWAKEIAKFSDQSTLVIDGGPKERQAQYDTVEQFGYVIVNYEQVVNDWDVISQLPCWTGPSLSVSTAIVFDEATAIKSFKAKRSKQCKELAKRFRFRFGLTGTPMENGRPEELYSIMQAIDASVLGARFDLFDQTFIVRNRFGGVERYRNLNVLHQRLKMACVRKAQRDADVAPYLPETIERDPVLVPFDAPSQALYQEIADRLLRELQQAAEVLGEHFSFNFNLDAHYGLGSDYDAQANAFKGRIMAMIVALRQVCDDPKLLISSAESFDPFVPGSGSSFTNYLFEEDRDLLKLAEQARASKFPVLKQLVDDHLTVNDENKAVVFVTYVDVARRIQEELGGVLFTGQMSSKEKEKAKEQFQTDPGTRLFVSTDAGGYGVDLPQANLLINYDLPWSSGTAVQRNGRIRRASSKWPSIVIQSILIEDSIEVRQFDMINQKALVASAVIDGTGYDPRGGVEMTVATLAQFLRDVRPLT